MPFGEAAPCRLPSANPAQTAAGQLQGSALSPGTCAALLDALHTVNSSSLCFALCPTPPRSFFAAKPAAGGGAPAATQHGDEQERSNGGEGGAKKAKTGMIPPCSRQSKTSTRELCTTTRCGKLHATRGVSVTRAPPVVVSSARFSNSRARAAALLCFQQRRRCLHLSSQKRSPTRVQAAERLESAHPVARRHGEARPLWR